MSDEAQVLYEEDGAIALITLNRPEKLNAISLAMLTRLDALAASLEASPTVRVVLITGAGGRSFCVGADINEWDAVAGGDPIAMWRAWDRPGHRIFERIARLQQPVIAAVNGFCFGGGLELALAADIRLAAAEAQFALPETKIGTQPGWTGTQRLPRAIGASRAKQMIFTGARIGAEQAERWGLVNEVMPAEGLLPRARELAGQIAANAPLAVQFAKTIVDAGQGEGAAM
ncbi:MAG TPA: enoyl-CoA hydratase/isomerase family protein, partial [Anaerolineae bacterium]